MKIAGKVEQRSAMVVRRGLPVMSFTVRGARKHAVVAFGLVAEKADRALRRGDRVEVQGKRFILFRKILVR